MKKLFTLLSLSLSLSFVKADFWTQKADFSGAMRSHPFSFSIGNKGYVGCGDALTDFWEYDPVPNAWTQKANFGTTLLGAAGFSINNKGYAVTGSYSHVLWEYDPVTNTWLQKANCGGNGRQYAAGFSLGNKGYTGGGYLAFNDFWQWDQVTDTWTQKANLPIGRSESVGFAMNGKGYICTGYDGTYLNDLWEYDALLNNWTQKATLPSFGRGDAAGFAICDKGYVGIGGESPYYNDFWQYDPVTNQWLQKADFPDHERDDAAYFSIGNKGYIGLGQYNNSIDYLDFWEYTPDSACTTGIEEEFSSASGGLQFSISPNPAKEFIVISYPLNVKERLDITITDAEGKNVYETKLLTPDLRLPASNFQKGIYFVELTNGKQKAVKKFVKE